MAIAEVILTESELEAIRDVSQRQGKTQEEILHKAIEQFLAQHKTETRLAALRQARGIWRERDDLPDFGELRSEWDRTQN